MKVQVAISVVAILIGLALMLSGQQMCRTSCWVDNLFRYFLPASLKSLAGGMPSLIVSMAIIGWAVFVSKK
ncbi:hypothetical protein [Comamonas jiangduensis]|uniref:hypothetical protein n=1 Tax=Comamonas jiangduensis TaxID=1194168 RepID=UPI003BF7E9BD